jgi:hypothetical protein
MQAETRCHQVAHWPVRGVCRRDDTPSHGWATTSLRTHPLPSRTRKLSQLPPQRRCAAGDPGCWSRWYCAGNPDESGWESRKSPGLFKDACVSVTFRGLYSLPDLYQKFLLSTSSQLRATHCVTLICLSVSLHRVGLMLSRTRSLRNPTSNAV